MVEGVLIDQSGFGENRSVLTALINAHRLEIGHHGVIEAGGRCAVDFEIFQALNNAEGGAFGINEGAEEFEVINVVLIVEANGGHAVHTVDRLRIAIKQIEHTLMTNEPHGHAAGLPALVNRANDGGLLEERHLPPCHMRGLRVKLKLIRALVNRAQESIEILRAKIIPAGFRKRGDGLITCICHF